MATAVKLNPKYTYNTIWLHIARKRAGQDDKQELRTNAANLDRSAWPWPVVAIYLGMSDAAAVQPAAAVAPDDFTRQDQVCEASFYVGEFDMASGSRTAAKPLLQAAVKECPRPFYEFFAATRELARPLPTPTTLAEVFGFSTRPWRCRKSPRAGTVFFQELKSTRSFLRATSAGDDRSRRSPLYGRRVLRYGSSGSPT